jgi:hypothetical protein
MLDTSLGDPAPGRSALEQMRTTPPAPPKPAFTISATRGDGGRDDRVRTTLLVERAERRCRGSGLRRGNGKSPPAAARAVDEA